MLIDLHAHLLPGIDDGAADLAHSIELARLADQEGIEHLVLTPHHRNGRYNNYAADVIQATDQLQAAYDQAGIRLRVYPGQEIRLTETFLDDLYNGQLLSLDGAGRYYLIEFPTRTVPSFATDLLSALISQGSTPIIAHPERNHQLAANYHELADLVQLGCLSQLTTSCVSGYYGPQLQATSLDLIRHGLAHLIASDVHHIKERPFNMRAAYQVIEDQFGGDRVHQFQETARQIFNGDPVRVSPPSGLDPRPAPKKKKHFFGLF